MIGAIQTAVSGMENASKMVDRAANNIAHGSAASATDMAKDAVDTIVGSRVYDANAKVVQVVAKMLDVFA